MATPPEHFADTLAGVQRDPRMFPTPEEVNVQRPSTRFTDVLAGAFGGGPDRQGAFAKGMDDAAAYRLRSAQTESALAQAEERRAAALAPQRQQQIYESMVADPTRKVGAADLLGFASNASDLSQGMLRFQEHGNRDILGDVNATPEAQFAAGQGVQGRMLPQVQALGSGREIGLLDQQAYTNPIGEADILAAEALAGQRDRSPVAGGGGGGSGGGGGAADGWKTVTVGGRRLRERIDPVTGAYESEFVTDPQMLGRERMFAERVRVAGESMADALENIADMPAGASMGVFGVGASPGTSILASTKDTLRNAATSEAVQMYTAALAGANRALAVLESAGLSPSGSTTQSFESLAWREGDTEASRLYKLAEMRQTVDNAMQTALTNPAVSQDMRDQVVEIIRRVERSVPFSPMDVLRLSRAPAGVTLQDIIRQQAPQAVPGGAATKPMPPDAELQAAAARRGTTVEALREQLRARGYQ